MAYVDFLKRNPNRGEIFAKFHQVQVRVEQFERNGFIFIDSAFVYTDRRSPLKTEAGGIYTKERFAQKLFELSQTEHLAIDRNGVPTGESFKDMVNRLDSQIQAEREEYLSTLLVKA